MYASNSVLLHIINFLQSIHSCVMCMDFEMAFVILEIGIVREPATTPGPLLLLARHTGDQDCCGLSSSIESLGQFAVFIFSKTRQSYAK